MNSIQIMRKVELTGWMVVGCGCDRQRHRGQPEAGDLSTQEDRTVITELGQVGGAECDPP